MCYLHLMFYHKYTYFAKAGTNICNFFFTVEPPSDLRFKILNENTVQMTWNVPLTRIEGFKIQVASDTGGWSVFLQVISLNFTTFTATLPV